MAGRGKRTPKARLPTRSAAPGATDREIVVTRLIDVPREVAYDAWTDRDRIGEWWAPGGFTTTSYAMDVKVGGEWDFTLHGPDGRSYPARVVYTTLERPEGLSYDHSSGLDDDSGRFRAIVTFRPKGNGTEVTWRTVFATASARDLAVRELQAVDRGSETLARLEAHLTKRKPDGVSIEGKDVAITRTFDAPRKRVFEAWTEPQRLVQWWGPQGFTCHSELDPRPGGRLRIVTRSADGVEFPITGLYREVVPLERLVYTADVSEHPEFWHDALNEIRGVAKGRFTRALLMTVTFEELGRATRLSVRTSFGVAPDRDAFVKFGMSEGWSQSLDRLQQFVTG